MKFLLDVSALIALGTSEHEFHPRIARWLARENVTAATCSITELGFLRIVSRPGTYGYDLTAARRLLGAIKKSRDYKFLFLADDLDAFTLPPWVRTSRQTTDGHLSALALRHKMDLATFDAGIPGAFRIP